MRRSLAAWLGLLLGGCATALPPPATTPPVSARDHFTEARAAHTSAAPLPAGWWRLFDDPVLEGHVRRALAANTDIRVALANLQTARAGERQSRAAALPVLGVESGAGPDRADKQPSTSSVPKTSYELGATFAYEIDLFGRLRAASQAARAASAASAAAVDAARLMVVADTVAAYVEVCGNNVALQMVEAQIAAQHQSAALVARRLDSGELSSLELAQAQARLERTRAALSPFAALRKHALFRLATLQAVAPAGAEQLPLGCASAVSDGLGAAGPAMRWSVPTVKSVLPVGDGAALLARRPDIREAQSQLAAATARIGVATADFYPRISLGGSAGLIGGGFDAILTPLISWSFFNQAAVRAKVAAARGGQAAALANWDAVVLRALREVETTLADYNAEQQRHTALEASLRASDIAATRARARHRLGAESYLAVLEVEQTRHEAAILLAASALKLAHAQVALFRALGGGWERG